MKNRNVYIILGVILLAFIFMMFESSNQDFLAKNTLYLAYSKTDEVLFVTVDELDDLNYYRMLEKDASFVFLNYDFDKVIYDFKGNQYDFYQDRIISIYDEFNEEEIIYRYDAMIDTNIYLGHINGYDIFDHNSYCLNTYEVLYECDLCIYEVKCSDLDLLLLHDGNDYVGTIKEGLDDDLFDIDELFYVNVDIVKEDK